MAKSPFTKRDEQRDVTRRALIKWTVAAGAALGVSRSKVFDILERTAGKGTAFAAAESVTARSVHIMAGNGGLAWFQLMWPHVDVAEARNNTFAWHLPGQETRVAGTYKPLVVGPDTPWKNLPASRQVTIFQCGNNETHTGAAVSTTNLNGSNIHAVASALQAASPSVIPIVSVGGAVVGTAPGGFQPAGVQNADGIVGLFNSAASRAGGLLSRAADASLYKAHFDAFSQLNRAANRSTTKQSYQTASSAAQFLGTNLAAKLAITPEDLIRYGINAGTPQNVAAIGRTFIVSVKAFKMGLTNAVVLNAFNDDPRVHGGPHEQHRRQHAEGSRGRHGHHDRWRHHEEPAAAWWLAGWHADELEPGLHVQRGPSQERMVRRHDAQRHRQRRHADRRPDRIQRRDDGALRDGLDRVRSGQA